MPVKGCGMCKPESKGDFFNDVGVRQKVASGAHPFATKELAWWQLEPALNQALKLTGT